MKPYDEKFTTQQDILLLAQYFERLAMDIEGNLMDQLRIQKMFTILFDSNYSVFRVLFLNKIPFNYLNVDASEFPISLQKSFGQSPKN